MRDSGTFNNTYVSNAINVLDHACEQLSLDEYFTVLLEVFTEVQKRINALDEPKLHERYLEY